MIKKYIIKKEINMEFRNNTSLFLITPTMCILIIIFPILSENRFRIDNDIFYNLYLKNNTGDDNFQITFAKRGVFKKINNTSILRLLDGQTISKVNNEFTNISFTESDLNLSNSKSNTTVYKKTQELSSINLIKCLVTLHEYQGLDNTAPIDIISFVKKLTIQQK